MALTNRMGEEEGREKQHVLMYLSLVFILGMAGLAQGAYVRGAMKGSGCIVGAQITAATGRTGQIRTSVQGVNYEANDKCSLGVSVVAIRPWPPSR